MTAQTILLEPLRLEHVDALWPVADDDVIRAWWPRRWADRSDVEAQVQMQVDEAAAGNMTPFLVRADGPDGAVAGSSSFYGGCFGGDPTPDDEIAIGWTYYLAPFRRTAVNALTKREMLQRAFEEDGFARVRFDIDALNLRSQGAVQRLGATRTAVVRGHREIWDGRVRDTVQFHIERADWPVVRDHLHGLIQLRSRRHSDTLAT